MHAEMKGVYLLDTRLTIYLCDFTLKTLHILAFSSTEDTPSN